MSDETAQILTALGGLTESVNNIKEVQEKFQISTEQYRERTHASNSKRDKKINTMEVILERVTTLVEGHDKIASSINVKYLDNLDEHHSFIARQIAKQKTWEAMRERLMEHGLKVILIVLIAAGFAFFGYDELAKRIAGG